MKPTGERSSAKPKAREGRASGRERVSAGVRCSSNSCHMPLATCLPCRSFCLSSEARRRMEAKAGHLQYDLIRSADLSTRSRFIGVNLARAEESQIIETPGLLQITPTETCADILSADQKRASGILPEDPSLKAKSVLPAGCRQHVADLPHAHPIAPSHFILREDGTIETLPSEGRTPRDPNISDDSGHPDRKSA